MYRSVIRLSIGVGFLVALLAQAPAQDKPPAEKEDKAPPKKGGPKEEYPDYFKTPETTEDYWTAIQFELDTGRPELAARLLAALLKREPTDEDLVKLDEKVGTAAFLRLRLLPKWSNDPKINEQAIKDADKLADRVGAALQKVYGDPKRISKFIKNLSGDREERSFAAKELYRSKALAIPPIIEELRPAQGEDRDAILTLLPRLAPETVPPLIAALDIPDDNLRLDLIEVLRKRGAKEAVPHLWYFAGSRKFPDRVRNKATQALAYLTETDAAKLLPAPIPLAREAERYYRHQVPFDRSGNVLIWRWDGKALVTGLPGTPKVTPTRAEEYYGLRFAREALDIDPTYAPAQQAFLSLALDKAMERTGLDQPLAKGAPDVQELLATVNPDLVTQVLDRALAEDRLPVILGAVRALGDLAETRANKPSGHGEPALVRALSYPDRRVQMAAADALLRIPSAPSPTAAGRVIDVLRRSAAIEAPPKAKPTVLIGFAEDAAGDAVARAAREIGFDVVKVRSGREALLRLGQAADVDALLIDTQLPDPGLASLLAQLRADPGFGGLPLWLVTPFETQESLKARQYQLDEDLRAFRKRKQALLAERDRTEANYLNAKGNAAEPFKVRLDKIDKELEGFTPAREDVILADRKRVERDLLTAPRDRESVLRRLVERQRHTWLLPEAAARDAGFLKQALAQPLADAAGQPLTEAERKDYAERSLRWLARVAKGELPGYDFRPAEDALYKALHSSTLGDGALTAAVEATGRLPGGKPQTELAAVVVDPKRPAAVRVAAATELLRHIQRHTPALTPAQVQALEALRAAKDTDAKLREGVALVIGATRPDARLTGERLKDFEPKPPAPPPPKEEKPKEEKE